MITEFAPAKINLFLHVGRVKPNGRHDLESLVVFAEDIGDTLQVSAGGTLSLALTGPMSDRPALGETADNLVLTAARALAKAAERAATGKIILDKRLPIAAGIGGGSADAAAALRAMTAHWGLAPHYAETIAPRLGGDVPVALHGKPAMMRGEGERVAGVKLPRALPAILVNPNIACPTGAVYAAFDHAEGGDGFTERAIPNFPDGKDGVHALINWLSVQSNDLEAPALTLQPGIADVLDALEALSGALLTRMSGSGATCFALFETEDAARAAASALAAKRPDWWVKPSMLGGRG